LGRLKGPLGAVMRSGTACDLRRRTDCSARGAGIDCEQSGRSMNRQSSRFSATVVFFSQDGGSIRRGRLRGIQGRFLPCRKESCCLGARVITRIENG
jgi:hypothetical protein